MLPLALTCGDPAGIGPDITLAAWITRSATGVAPFYLIGDPAMLASRAARLGLEIPIRITRPAEAGQVFATALPVVPLAEKLADSPGRPDVSNAPGIVSSIDRAVADVSNGQAAALVTNPIAKKVLYQSGFAYPGHTEYLGHLASRLAGRPVTPVMMLAGPDLRAVPVTIHVALAEAPRLLNSAAIVEVGEIVAADLQARFGIARPRLAVSGLNPHAGEEGAMGDEEERIIRPAIETLRAAGIEARGPLPADTMFHARARATYDAAICMYHDQALIAAKALAFDETVNVTLGLPFIRTSPDHGTAFDIAGSGKARPDSLIAALKLAGELATHSGRVR